MPELRSDLNRALSKAFVLSILGTMLCVLFGAVSDVLAQRFKKVLSRDEKRFKGIFLHITTLYTAFFFLLIGYNTYINGLMVQIIVFRGQILRCNSRNIYYSGKNSQYRIIPNNEKEWFIVFFCAMWRKRAIEVQEVMPMIVLKKMSL